MRGTGDVLETDLVDPEAGRRQCRVEKGGGAIDVLHRRKGDRTRGRERHRRGRALGLGRWPGPTPGAATHTQTVGKNLMDPQTFAKAKGTTQDKPGGG